jgi:photosystem II stability/assembly factor-like uncharacterized protein
MHLKRITPLFSLSILLLASLACNLGIDFNPPPLPSQIPPAAATHTPVVIPAVATVTALPTFTPIPMDTPVAPNPQIRFFKMVDANTGWASNENGLLRTSDGGLTWTKVNVPNFTPSSYPVQPYALDASHAWFISGSPGSESGTLFRTSDGGATWENSPVPFNSGSLVFIDPQNGWVMAGLGVAAGSMAVSVHQTSDGGLTWTQTFINRPDAPGASDSLPLGGLKSGLAARNMQIAWIGGLTYAPGSIYLHRSDDGGHTWAAQSISIPDGTADGMFEARPPVFVSAQDAYLPVRINLPTGVNHILYVSHNAGDSWMMTAPLVANGPVDVLSVTDAVIWSGSQFMVTRDGGQTYTPVTPNVDFSQSLSSMDFIDLNTGWVLTMNADGKTALFKTSDGGATWTQISGAAPASGSALTPEMLKNGLYTTPFYGKTVTLADGSYEAGSGPDYLMVKLLDQVAFGDLNGDGVDDAAVILAENAGGSGVFVSVVVMLNQNGLPVQSGAALVDDRPKINSLSIQNGLVVVDAVIHGINDSMVNPTLNVTETYQIVTSGLTLTRFTSKTPDGRERAINITSAEDDPGTTSAVRLKGDMPIAPFENNLVYSIYSATGEKLTSGPFMVQAADMGKPATFDNPIDLSGLPSGSLIRIELAELSAADGSTMALASVFVMTK